MGRLLGVTTLNITTFYITILNIKCLYVTLSITMVCHYAERRVLFIVMLSVVAPAPGLTHKH